MRNNRESKERRPCQCLEATFAPNEWVYTECPFGLKAERAWQKEGRPMEFYKTLVCSCGNEIGEVEFSGPSAGRWRTLQGRLMTEDKLNRFREYMQVELFKELTSSMQKMSKI